MTATKTHGRASSQSPSERVVAAVAETEGVDPRNLTPLYEAVDPEALDALLQRRGNSPGIDGIGVTFTYHGYEVTVREDGRILLDGRPRTE